MVFTQRIIFNMPSAEIEKSQFDSIPDTIAAFRTSRASRPFLQDPWLSADPTQAMANS